MDFIDFIITIIYDIIYKMSFEKMLHFIHWCFLRYVLGKGPFSPVRYKDMLEKGHLASAFKVYFENPFYAVLFT